MLDLTDGATSVVNTITERQLGTEDGGLRIADAGDGNLAISAVDGGESADTLVEKDGARVYLEPTAADVLDDKVLDAQITPSGEVEFALAQQDQTQQDLAQPDQAQQS